MKPTIIFQEFEQLAEALDIKIVQEKGTLREGIVSLKKMESL